MTLDIVIIGAGNVGYHLANALTQNEHRIVQMFSRNAQRFANIPPSICNSFTTKLSQLNPSASLYLIAVSDDAIEIVSPKIQVNPKAIIAHTSGATPSTVLQNHPQYGVFYPLQSFSRQKAVDFTKLPLLIDASDATSLQTLLQVANSISQHVHPLTDQQRQYLHVSAVFANNFTNHLLHIAHQICEQNQVPFEVLKPLITETANKIQTHPPRSVQTGPAIRGDQKTIDNHLALLHNNTELQKMYGYLSKSIQGDLDFKSIK